MRSIDKSARKWVIEWNYGGICEVVHEEEALQLDFFFPAAAEKNDFGKKTLMKQPWVANFTTFFLILCILYFPRSLPQNMLFRGSGNLNRRRERELFELKSFCVFIAEEEIKIPILFSSANSMAEGNLIWCFHLDYKFIEADEDFFSLLNSKLFPSPNKARLIYLSRLECVDPIIDVTISG